MKFKRNPMNAWYAFWRAIDRAASRVKVIRFIMGGYWVKMDGQWWQMDASRAADSLHLHGVVNGEHISIHERNVGIEALEHWS